MVCDGYTNCNGISEERNCGNSTEKTPDNITAINTAVKTQDNTAGKTAKNNTAETGLVSWFLSLRKSGPRTERWGSQVHRIAVALHLADNTTFGPGSSTGEEIRNELKMQLLHRLSK
ncbi:hypothetical protein AVEN_130039-1 [Araneus ventricosus]|uniref:Uncharacterized protein n=1 Tax=Araneus ventricosus TaxID=182803 RepID=A0A4Y2GLC0_ARAVE|nr:hypothetical protein AVEN_30161-1 [Araneus ventricosus]GBM54141.1 hypothetical protein AVEN_130039-1 [Araneus ventricosus]